ncbi:MULTISPECIES: HpcH/HpaI aldolase/citrate lyase family protein [Sporosarcina]|uniref:HpcH/HpaI aldolase/citrate lyase family protein n=1 Tax=Sporosarcina TaxID=1569 RepID=UPI00129BDDA1|nr:MULTISPECIES: CoA ester lyase [Sporosarcina]GKV64486.1 citrate lyase [Sporosarcina sp. NCCP-2331]GLB57518.1 citrate lyase [Sporosarcina sp. NCCP-2378]
MLLRSLLFVPGNNEKVIAKAEQLPADVIIYDLEDAVALDQKADARERVCAALSATAKSVVVRVNSMETPYFLDDIQAVASVKADTIRAIMLPKTNRDADVMALDQLLTSLDVPANVEILPLLETALGVQNAFDIGCSSDRVKRLAFGSVDFGLDIGATLTAEGTELLYARSRIVLASRAAELQKPIDTVFVDFRDTAGLEKEAVMVKGLGFGGKLAIHPAQVDSVNSIFQPTQAEKEEAAEIMAYVEEHGAAVFQLHGKMVDEPIIKRARQICQLAKMLDLKRQEEN